MTLDDLLQKCAIYAKKTDTLIPVGGPYTADAEILADRFTMGLNNAKNMIANERYAPTYRETVVLDASLEFSLSALTKRWMRTVSIWNADGGEVFDWFVTYGKIRCPSLSVAETITIEYTYLPADLSALTDVLDFPTGIVDPVWLCHYAMYEYFITDASNRSLTKADYFLSLWNNDLAIMAKSTGEHGVIIDVYGGCAL